MAIEFQCPQCNATLRLKEKFAGQRGACKHCGGEIVVPAAAGPVARKSSLLEDSSQPVVAPRPVSQPAPQKPVAKPVTVKRDADLIRFPCDKCGASIKTPSSAAGRTVTCPRCAERLRVPGAPAARASAPLKPVTSPNPAPQPAAKSPAARPVAAPAPRPAARPPAAAANPPQEDLELLPEEDLLEPLPVDESYATGATSGGFLDALDDTIPLAKSDEPLRPLPRPVAPVAVKKPRRDSSRSVSKSGVLAATGGGATTLIILIGIALRLFGALAPVVDPNKVDSTYLAQSRQVIQDRERCVQITAAIAPRTPDETPYLG